MRILAEEGIAALPSVEKDVETPCGIFKGVEIDERNCIAVSIIRAGDSLLDAVRFCLPSVQVGKILRFWRVFDFRLPTPGSSTKNVKKKEKTLLL